VHDLGPRLAAGEDEEETPLGKGGEGGEGGEGGIMAVGLLVQKAAVEVGRDEKGLGQG
jgi:hypothetical protein